MYNTAKGIYETIGNRKFDIDVFSFEQPMQINGIQSTISVAPVPDVIAI